MSPPSFVLLLSEHNVSGGPADIFLCDGFFIERWEAVVRRGIFPPAGQAAEGQEFCEAGAAFQQFQQLRGFLQEVGITFRKLGRVTDKPGDFILPHQKQGERKLQFPAVRATRRSDFGCVPQTEQKAQQGSDACLCLTARILPLLPHPDADIGPVEQSYQQPRDEEKTGKADDENSSHIVNECV